MGELYSNLRPAISFSATFAGTVYVAWEVCGKTMCKSYYWSEAEGTKRVLVPTEKAAYNPTIDETAGSVYFVRAPANGRCGTNITIGREALGSSAYTMLTTLPRGVDAGDRMSLAPNSTTGFQDLYFDRWNCRTSDADIYALRSVDA